MSLMKPSDAIETNETSEIDEFDASVNDSSPFTAQFKDANFQSVNHRILIFDSNEFRVSDN